MVIQALCIHVEANPQPAARDWALIVPLGLGPLGAAFFLWDRALKTGDARRIGLLAYLTPLASTALLALTTGRALTAWTALAALLIVGAALVAVTSR